MDDIDDAARTRTKLAAVQTLGELRDLFAQGIEFTVGKPVRRLGGCTRWKVAGEERRVDWPG